MHDTKQLQNGLAIMSGTDAHNVGETKNIETNKTASMKSEAKEKHEI